MMKSKAVTSFMNRLKHVPNRPSIESYFMKIAQVAKSRSTCARRRVGCVLVDKDNHLISTGYNGVPKGMTHCYDDPCDGAGFKSGEGLEKCNAIHAEINAIAHCENPKRIYAAYVTVSPCTHCIKALLATPCEWLFFGDEYAHRSSLELWTKGGRHYRLI